MSIQILCPFLKLDYQIFFPVELFELLIYCFVVVICLFVLGQILSLLPRLECSGMIRAHCSLELLGSSDPLASVSQSAGIIGMSHHFWPGLAFFIQLTISAFYSLTYVFNVTIVMVDFQQLILLFFSHAIVLSVLSSS